MTDGDRPFTLSFIGWADHERAERAGAYEDRVLALLPDHGAELRFRGRRVAGQDASLPLEVHLIRFPDRGALETYLADERRLALRAEFGEVFTSTQVVEVEELPSPTGGGAVTA